MKAIAGGMLAIVLVAGCGSSSSHTAAVPTTNKVTGTTANAVPAKDFCAVLKDGQQKFASANSSDLDVAQLEEGRRLYGDAIAAAPAELKGDLGKLATLLDKMIAAVKAAGPDKAKQTSAIMAVALNVGTPDMKAAVAHLDAYAKDKCGINTETSSSW
ncbi:MAG TPA: hypothetical protein VFR41_00755 [Acidimicrobiia bacterium]|nr:hypothetical protein [Acidimicrobiia bacterium]